MLGCETKLEKNIKQGRTVKVLYEIQFLICTNYNTAILLLFFV